MTTPETTPTPEKPEEPHDCRVAVRFKQSDLRALSYRAAKLKIPLAVLIRDLTLGHRPTTQGKVRRL